MSLTQQLIDKGAVPNLPLIRHSSILCLCVFMEELVEMKWELHLATAVFICAHCIRTPHLLRTLLSHLKRRNRPSRLSQLILELETILKHASFNDQLDALPILVEWLEPDMEHDFTVACDVLENGFCKMLTRKKS